MEIRELVKDWANQSYEDGYKAVELSNQYTKRTMEKLKVCLCELNRFTGHKMDGNSVMGLYRNEGDELYEGIRFTDAVKLVMNDDDFTPVKYMARVTELCNERGMSNQMAKGILARGLRILPSFLRETDANEQLEKYLKARGISYSITRSSEMDVRQHTDIKVDVGDNAFRIWLFQNSLNGQEKTTKRLKGERGALPEGIHILCPMNPVNSASENKTHIKINGWCFYSDAYINNIVDCIENFKPEKALTYEEFKENIDLSQEKIQMFIKK